VLAKLGSKLAFKDLWTDVNPIKLPFINNILCMVKDRFFANFCAAQVKQREAVGVSLIVIGSH